MDNRYFDIAKKKVKYIFKDREKLIRFLLGVTRKINTSNLGFLNMGTKLKVILRMVKAYAAGKYKLIPWKSIIILTAVLTYFLMPLDLIPVLFRLQVTSMTSPCYFGFIIIYRTISIRLSGGRSTGANRINK